MSESKILLGFEAGSGKAVYMKIHHTVVTGMTQLSGKTTTMEAIIFRSRLRAIAFKTKRGESGFRQYHEIPPFFQEKADWRYVQSLLEATMKERMKFERSWIIKASKGTKTLKEVLVNVQQLKSKTRPDSLSEGVYTVLEEYLKIVVPQIESFKFSQKLEIEDGINVMDVSSMSLEMRSLVIRSVMEYAIEYLNGTIVIVPEAWEYLPQGTSTPVKWYAETFIRKGASVEDYLLVDSQDIAGIDKTPLRQCDNWIMGRQKEAHEVERVREEYGKQISDEEIRGLQIGFFFAYIGDEKKKVYVLPADVPEEIGKRVALGELSPDYVKENYLKRKGEDDDELWHKKYDELKQEIEGVKAKVSNEVRQEMEKEFEETRKEAFEEGQASVESKIVGLATDNKKMKDELERLDGEMENLHHTDAEIKAVEDLKVALRSTFAILFPQTVMSGLKDEVAQTVEIKHTPVEYRITDTEPSIVKIDTGEVAGKILCVAKKDLFEDASKDGFTETQLLNAMRERGWVFTHQTISPHLAKLDNKGHLIKIAGGGRGNETRYRLPSKVPFSIEEQKEKKQDAC